MTKARKLSPIIAANCLWKTGPSTMRHCLAALRRRPSAQYFFIVVIISAIFPTSFYLMRSAPGFTSSPARVIMTLDGEGHSPALLTLSNDKVMGPSSSNTLSNDKVMGPSSSKGPPRQRPQLHHVVERILNASELHPESLLSDLLRAEIICSNSSLSSPPCPVFHPDLHKFENMAQDTVSVQLWSKIAQPAAIRAISLQMWFEKRMDVAAARVLGCAVVDGHEFTAAFATPNDLTGTHGMCRLHQQINLVQPLVSHSYRGRVINRTEYLHDPQSNEWFKSFGYNPLHISDSRLAYEAPAFTQEDWMEFCFRQVALQSKTSEDPSPQSRAWYACSSFAASTLSRNYHYGMLKCFDVPSTLMSADATQLTALLSTYGSHRQYVEQCRSNDNGISDDPWSLRDLSRAVFNVLRDRWDVVQSVYELAIYESNRDVQRSDEYVEALQWNTCHPHVQALHLFVETDASAAYFQSIMNSTSFHNPCNKLHSVPIWKRMHYKDALVYANTLVGRTVMITNADVVLGQGFGSIPDLSSFLKENNRMFALSRHERPARGFTDRYMCCHLTMYDGCHDAFVFVSPVKEEVYAAVDHQQNMWGAEAKFIYEIVNVAGMNVNNPCFQFQIIHNHATDLRRNTAEGEANLVHDMTCCPGHNVTGPCLDKKFCPRKGGPYPR